MLEAAIYHKSDAENKLDYSPAKKEFSPPTMDRIVTIDRAVTSVSNQP
jgi:hypothetical protein